MTETFTEAQREARAEALLNDPAKKAERVGRNRVQARKTWENEFHGVFNLALMEAKAQDGDQERVENQIRAVWPKDLLGKFKSTSRRPGMWAPFAKIGEFVHSVLTMPVTMCSDNNWTRFGRTWRTSHVLLKPMQEDTTTKLLKNARSQVTNWRRYEALDEQILPRCAVEVLKRLISVLTRKHVRWAKNNTLCPKIGQADLACESVSTSYAMG